MTKTTKILFATAVILAIAFGIRTCLLKNKISKNESKVISSSEDAAYDSIAVINKNAIDTYRQIDSISKAGFAKEYVIKSERNSIEAHKTTIKNEKIENKISNKRVSDFNISEIFRFWASFDTAGYYKLTR